MKFQPTLKTERLVLRPFTPADAPMVQRLAGDREIADTTMNIPHPYSDSAAREWISTHAEQLENDRIVTYAIVLRETDQLIGAISLTLRLHFDRAEMGYWVGKDFWNRGYCTEAANAILKFGFEKLKLNRIFAEHFTRNPASGVVMEKIGMSFEGCLRQHMKKWGKYEDMNVYSILREEFDQID